MTEEEAKLKYEVLDKESRDLYLQAARKGRETEMALQEWQKICSHEFGEKYNLHHHLHHRDALRQEFKKCKLVITY